jgi:cobalt-zinc-cadmium efflux system membrane fusion protein
VGVFSGAGLSLVTAMTLTACGQSPHIGAHESPPAVSPQRRDLTMTREQIQHGGIAWQPVHEATMTDSIEVPAQVVPNEDRTARLGASARARVITVHVRIGDRVSRDQPLVTLQSEQASAARADYAKAAAELTAHDTASRYARAALDRAERLLTLKAVSRQDVERARVESEEAESGRLQAHADVERARATLAQLGVTAQTGEMVVRAPLAGVVLSREAVPGSVVDAGAPLLTVTDPATLWLDIAATERVAPVLRRGNQVRFTVAELLPQTFDATIENVGAALDPSTRTLPVHGIVRNAAGTLRPAMFATVTLTMGQPRTGVTVPDSALQSLDQRPVVFVAQPAATGGARFDRRDVEVGARAGADVQIVRGLNAGDMVVTEGAFAVKSEFARSSRPPE